MQGMPHADKMDSRLMSQRQLTSAVSLGASTFSDRLTAVGSKLSMHARSHACTRAFESGESVSWSWSWSWSLGLPCIPRWLSTHQCCPSRVQGRPRQHAQSCNCPQTLPTHTHDQPLSRRFRQEPHASRGPGLQQNLTIQANGGDVDGSVLQAPPLALVRGHPVVHRQLVHLVARVQAGPGVAQVGNGEQLPRLQARCVVGSFAGGRDPTGFLCRRAGGAQPTLVALSASPEI